MAVTKTHPIKSTLKAAIDYICNPDMAVYTHSHSACCCEHPSCPILIEREKREQKKT